MRTHLDLFSGIGGFALAAQWNGFTTVGFCEIEPYAQKVLIEKFGAILADALPAPQRGQPWQGKARLHADIFTLRGTDYAGVNLITGGFPCQPFSCAGQRRGAADDRHLWPEMLRVIGEARPAWVLAENVPGIIGMELDAVLSDLENIGYACWPVVVPACAVDARHRRDRVWIVAHAAGPRGQRGRTTPRQAQGTPDLSSGPSEDVAHTGHGNDTERTRAPGREASERAPVGSISGPSGEVASDALGVGCKRQRASRVEIANPHGPAAIPLWNGGDCAVWLPEPELGRVVNGIPNRSHRLKGLGNAIVPQVAAQIISWMT